MININLLYPHKKHLEAQKKNIVKLMIIAAIIAGIVLSINFVFFLREKSVIEKSNNVLRSHIRTVMQKMPNQSTINDGVPNAIEHIGKLHNIDFQRNKVIILFNDLTRLTPESIYLSILEA